MASHAVGEKGPFLISRRKLIYGAAGIGALALIGGGVTVVNNLTNNGSDEIATLAVPKSALTTQNDMEALDDYEDNVTLVASYDLPYGSLVWTSDSNVAACLLPTETGSPLAQIGLLFLGSGVLETVRTEAIGKTDGFEIFDVRATSSGLVWTESNIMQNAWKIYSAELDNGTLGTSILLDEGTSTYEMPSLGIVGSYVFWQKIPRDAKDKETTSQVLRAPFGSSSSECVYESKYRSATPLYTDSESIVITPRLESSTVYHQLTRIDAKTGQIQDALTLPYGMKPLEAGYGKTGFMFSFPDIYNYGEGISNLGTYVPYPHSSDTNYNTTEWFSFARTPSAPPMWAGNLLIVKSTYSVCGVNLVNDTYFAIDVENGADSFGEYLASTGTQDSFVTFTNIDHTPIGEDRIYTCRVKVWEPAN